jgi:S1-C subfamily serine protease
MSQQKSSLFVIAILIALLGVILSCCVGMMGGVITGGWAARSAVRQAVRSRALRLESAAGTPAPSTGAPTATPAVPRDFLRAGYAGGALLTAVTSGGPADRSGLEVGDVVVAVGNDQVTDRQTLADLVRALKPGTEVTMRYWRDGAEHSAGVRLDPSPQSAELAYLGVSYSPVSILQRTRPD